MARRVVIDSLGDAQPVAVLEADGDEVWMLDRGSTLEDIVDGINTVLARMEADPPPARLPCRIVRAILRPVCNHVHRRV